MFLFKWLTSLAILFTSIVEQSSSFVLFKKQTNCQNITIPISAAANNALLPDTLTYLTLSTLLGSLDTLVFDTLVSGNFNISGTYCAPTTIIPSRANTLQFLVHGITYTRSYWFGEHYKADNSWVAAANAQGYPVLAIDRLGSGLSSTVDIYVVPMAGHCWQLHTDAPQAFGVVHQWLSYKGF